MLEKKLRVCWREWVMNKHEFLKFLYEVRSEQEDRSDLWYVVDEIIYEAKKLETMPKKMNILEIEAMLDDIGWWDTPTEEQVIVKAIEKGEIGHNGETYKVIKEEPKYYAMVKGGDLLSEEKYWNLWVENGTLEIGDNKVHPDVNAEYMLKATKDEWNALGINDTNADFEEADDNG